MIDYHKESSPAEVITTSNVLGTYTSYNVWSGILEYMIYS